MKFGALLRHSADDLPEIMCLFNTYKQLKKQLKKMPDRAQMLSDDPGQQQKLTVEEAAFVATIDKHLADLNNMFIEKEEDMVIRLEALQAGAKAATQDEQRRTVYKGLVNFHGEVLLLVHWSILAYTATVKILKKHHKRTGLLLRAPHLENLLGQPFCSTELMNQLANKAEESIRELAQTLTTFSTAESTLAPHTAGAAAIAAAAAPADDAAGSGDAVRSETTTGAAGPSDSPSGAVHGHRHAHRAHKARRTAAAAAIAAAVAGVAAEDSDLPGALDSQPQQSSDGIVQGPVISDDDHDDHDTDDDDSSWGTLSGEDGSAVGSCSTLAAAAAAISAPAGGSRRFARPAEMTSMLRRMQVALDTWAQLCSTAHTPSTILPPEALAQCRQVASAGACASRGALGAKRAYGSAFPAESADEVCVHSET